MEKGFNWNVFIACLIVVYFAASVGSLFTGRNVNTAWYDSMKPAITPPNWVFPVVWNILFFLIACSLYLAWTRGRNKKKTATIFGLNLDLNMIWGMIYFDLRNAYAGLLEVGLLWISIALMMIYTWKIDKRASLLLAPYLLWVSFASYLNWLSV